MRAAAYTRVSSAGQAERYSLPVQRADLADYARRQGWPDPVGYEDAGVSAYTDDFTKRPAFARLLADAEAGLLDVVLCIKLDRFARNAKLARQALDRLLAAGCRLVSVYESLTLEPTTTAVGMFQFSLFTALAEMDSHAKGERIARALAARKAEGKRLGHAPWGARRVDGWLVVDPARAADLAEVRARAATASDTAIAAALNRRGVPAPRGGLWHDSSVRNLIARGDWLLDQPPPWPERWLAARARPRLPHIVSRHSARLLTGLMRCACGGRVYYGKHSVLADGATFRGVQCRHLGRFTPAGTGCPYRKTDVRRYEAQTLAFLAALRPRDTPSPAAPPVADVRAARAELAERRRLIDKRFARRSLPEAEYDAAMDALDLEEAALLRAAVVVPLAEDWDFVRARLPTLAPPEQNAVARALCDHVLITGAAARPVLRAEVARVLAGPADTAE